jgi:hypothetical protein
MFKGLKGIVFSFKELLVSRAYTSSALDAISTEVVEDTSFTLVGSLENTSQAITCITHPFEHHHLSGCFLQHSLLLGVVLLCYLNYHFMPIQREKNIIQRLEPFVPSYATVRKRTKALILFFFFVFFRNVDNAI